MIVTSSRRPGLSLLEVLVAIFVMGIGIISLLVLFPLGLQSAKWALDNEQIGRAAATGQVLCEVPDVKVIDNGTFPLPIVSVDSQSMRVDDTFRPVTSNNMHPWWRLTLPNIPANAVQPRLQRDFFLMSPPTALTPRVTWTFASTIDPVTLNTFTGGTCVNPPLGATRLALPPVFVDPAVASDINLNVTFTQFDPALPAALQIPFSIPFHVGATAPVGPAPTARLPFANHPTFIVSANRPQASLGLPRFSLAPFRADPLFRSDVGAMVARLENEITAGDEMTFDQTGRPALDGTRRYYNGRRFSWAYLCRWPDFDHPDVCDVATVLFNTRPFQTSSMTGRPPGEETYLGLTPNPANAGHDPQGFGRMFIKGLTSAVLPLQPGQAPTVRAGDWLLDNTFILPEFDQTFPGNKAPFLDQFSPATVYTFATGTPLRPGLCGGHFYKIVDVSTVQAVGAEQFVVVTLDRPARSDGFVGTVFASAGGVGGTGGVVDVIEKGVGRMPQR